MARRSKKARAATVTYRAAPTAERMVKAGGNFEVGNDKNAQIITIRDAPIDRLRNQNERDRATGITKFQYDAGMKYRHHWHHAGLEANFSALDLGRVFGGDGGGFLPATEWQVQHRQHYRKARDMLGPKLGAVTDAVVCAEMSLADTGAKLGWLHPTQGRAVITELLREALDKLKVHWGM